MKKLARLSLIDVSLFLKLHPFPPDLYKNEAERMVIDQNLFLKF